MNTLRRLATLTAACTIFFSTVVAAQAVEGFLTPFSSQAAASSISEAAIVEMPLDGTGAFQMTWAGVAQYGHGPVQLVLELPKAGSALGVSCLKFITMRREGNAYVSTRGNYIFTYESRRIALGNDSNRPNPERFSQFERSITINKKSSTWQASVIMRGNERRMRWIDDNGQVQAKQDIVAAMKPLQQIPHCFF